MYQEAPPFLPFVSFAYTCYRARIEYVLPGTNRIPFSLPVCLPVCLFVCLPVCLSVFLIHRRTCYWCCSCPTFSYDGAERKDGRPWVAFTENFWIMRLARGYHDFQVMILGRGWAEGRPDTKKPHGHLTAAGRHLTYISHTPHTSSLARDAHSFTSTPRWSPPT